MDKPIIILGAGGIGKSAMESFISNDVLVFGFLDENPKLTNQEIGDAIVLGTLEEESFLGLIGKDCEAFIAVEDTKLRKNLAKLLMKEYKVMPVNAIHKRTILASSAIIGHGNYIGAGVMLGSNVTIGNHLLLHPGAIINYEAQLGDFVQIGAGSIVNSGVVIEESAFVGSGVTIVSGVKIGAGARIGAGSVVINDVLAKQTVFGNPAVAVS